MCICIDCKFVDQCETYHMVEEKHEQPHLTEQPTFSPQNPTIMVHIRKMSGEADGMLSAHGREFDVIECESFCEEKGKWIRLRPGEAVPT